VTGWPSRFATESPKGWYGSERAKAVWSGSELVVGYWTTVWAAEWVSWLVWAKTESV
jgi:hypothetical protein